MNDGRITAVGRTRHGQSACGRDGHRSARQDRHAGARRRAQSSRLHRCAHRHHVGGELHARQPARSAPALRVLRHRRDAEPRPRSRRAALSAARVAVTGRRAVSHRRTRHRHAERGTECRLLEGRGLRRDDGGRGAGGGARAGREESGHRQDLGGRPEQDGHAAAAVALSADHRGGARARPARGRARVLPGRREGAAARRHRRLRARHSRPRGGRGDHDAVQAASAGLRHPESAGHAAVAWPISRGSARRFRLARSTS